jgi:hypothetical protein
VLENWLKFDAFQSPVESFFRPLLEGMYEQRMADPQAKEVCKFGVIQNTIFMLWMKKHFFNFKKFNDIFQILLNAVDEDENGENEEGVWTKENIEQNGGGVLHKKEEELALPNSNKNANKKHLSKIEFMAQSFVLIVAG